MPLFAGNCLQKSAESRIVKIETSVDVKTGFFLINFPYRPFSRCLSDSSVTKICCYHLRFNCVKMHSSNPSSRLLATMCTKAVCMSVNDWGIIYAYIAVSVTDYVYSHSTIKILLR